MKNIRDFYLSYNVHYVQLQNIGTHFFYENIKSDLIIKHL